jgi:ribonuclease VapC
MIVVDTSALIAIMKDEDDAGAMIAAVLSARQAVMSVVSIVEATLVASSALDLAAVDAVNEYVEKLGLSVRGVDEAQMNAARLGFLTYGKGRHAAALNFGDCFSYGLARTLNAPLHFKGDDFSRTDMTSAIARA